MNALASYATPHSLLRRLRKVDNQEAWSRFVRLYTPLLYSWARKLGFSPDDAADCVQDAFVVLVVEMPQFKHDKRHRFRAWLWTVFLNRCRQTKRRHDLLAEARFSDLDLLPSPDPGDDLAEIEYRDWLVHFCLERIRAEFPDATWGAFWDYVALDKPAATVAEDHAISVAVVYQTKTRVLRRLQQAFLELPG